MIKLDDFMTMTQAAKLAGVSGKTIMGGMVAKMAKGWRLIEVWNVSP